MRSYRRPARRIRTVPRTSARRQAFGNFASAMQQRDSTNVVISTQEDVTLTVPQNGLEGTLVRNCNAILCDAQYFQNYLGMYDQYKINAIRASLEMTYISNDLLNQQKFPSICTAWDRNGIKITSVNAGIQGAPNYRYLIPTYDIVSSYSSANEKTIYYGSRWGVIRQLDAASMMEKSMYIPTSNTRDVLTHGNMYSAWNPMLLIAVHTSGDNGVVADQSCVISIHWQFDITLRGLRKVATDTMSAFKPNAKFIGYAKTNKGLAVPNLAGNGYLVVGGAGIETQPTINPDYEMPVGSGTGILVPNDGTAANNIGI